MTIKTHETIHDLIVDNPKAGIGAQQFAERLQQAETLINCAGEKMKQALAIAQGNAKERKQWAINAKKAESGVLSCGYNEMAVYNMAKRALRQSAEDDEGKGE